MWKTIKKILVVVGYFGILFTIYSFFTNPIMQLKDAEISLLKSQRDDCKENLRIIVETSDSLRKELQKKSSAGSVSVKPKNIILEPTEIGLSRGIDLFDGNVTLSHLGLLDGKRDYIGITGAVKDTFVISIGQQHHFKYRNGNYVLNILGMYSLKDSSAMHGLRDVVKISVYREANN